jgi:Ca2+-binding EF-hand superfamily protein
MDDPRVADGGGLGMAVIVLEGGGLPNPDSLDFVVLTSAAAQSEAARRLKALRQAMPTRPAAEVHVRLSSERGTVTVTADKLTKGVMARKEGNGIVLEVGKAHLSLGGPRRGSSTVFSVADGSEAYQMLFKQADADGNGYLDRKEAATVPLFGRNFDAIDADGDGMIFEKEVSAFLKKRATLQASVKAATAELSITEQGQGLFDLLDLNRDGVLSVRELRRAPEVLKLLGVKELAASDVPRQLLGTLAPGGDSGGLGFFAVNTLDLGGERPARPAPGKGPEWFRKMDRNGDGDVSRSEWLGTREEFARIDADRDGLISPEEAEAYDRAVRKKGAE